MSKILLEMTKKYSVNVIALNINIKIWKKFFITYGFCNTQSSAHLVQKTHSYREKKGLFFS